ncbi:hypothetical protein FRC10_003833 [Ceratobasidium sp. 414]|nr:hypothetical protein FRC10_003833 [Ceratobasidium sp. 414]
MSGQDAAGIGGCCGFDEDAWDKEEAETRKKRTAANQAKSTQPASTPQMAVPTADDANATK